MIDNQSTITISTETITPSIARRWLDLNVKHNRNKKPTVIERYARDMKSGNWFDTGDTIKFDCNGGLIDGQQRLNAIIKSGVTIDMWVVRGLDPESMVVVDTGTPRTFADSLKITHATHTSTVGSIVRRVLNFHRGNYTGGTSSVFINPTRVELMQYYRENMGEFDTAAQRGKDIVNQRLGNGTSAGTGFFLFARLDKDAAHDFFDMVLSGADLSHGHPALTLSRRLAQREWNTSEQLAAWIRCWNAYRADEKLTKIQLTRQGPLSNLNFPQPK